MAHGPRYRVAFRRRREGRTDYRRRLKMLTTKRTRVVVRPSLNNVVVQFVNYGETGDGMVAQASAVDLRKQGYDGHTGNMPAAYLAGVLAGQRAKHAGIEEAVLDIGDHAPIPGSRLFAVLAGILDAGVTVPHSEDMLPLEDRLTGKHISADVSTKVTQLKNQLAPGPSPRTPRTAKPKAPKGAEATRSPKGSAEPKAEKKVVPAALPKGAPTPQKPKEQKPQPPAPGGAPEQEKKEPKPKGGA